MPPPLPPETIQALLEFDAPTISNAIEHFRVRDPVAGYASLELRCQFPDYKPMAGYAITVTADTTTPGDKRPMRLDELLDVVHAAPKPAVLVYKHVGTDRLKSCFVGDMICTSLQKLGVVGVVTDGGGRDASGIRRRAPGFQIFSPGWVVSHGYVTFLDFGVTVSVCGLTIQPGDLLFGDESGLLTVPLDIADALIQRAAEMREGERQFFEFLESRDLSFQE
ncbi:MAG TPA: hypothetical protein VFD70_07715, partial [Anaerolineae bacterium]|nr:hypothetical protein [Anaerolineae bacterium]